MSVIDYHQEIPLEHGGNVWIHLSGVEKAALIDHNVGSGSTGACVMFHYSKKDLTAIRDRLNEVIPLMVD